jgi:peptidoglycan/xylan/chitin deacetylase (PgdA/CDA1 family)
MMEQIDVDPARELQDRVVNEVVCHDARLGPPDSNTLVRPPLYGGGAKKIIALTFDDGPSRHTRRIVSRLLRLDSGATFFQVANAFRSRTQPIGRYERRHGLTLGSHTATHPDLGRLSQGAQRREILRGARAITRRGGPYPRLFRPPYDSYNAATLYALRDLGMRLVLQTVDTQDWHPSATRNTIARRALRGARPGGIILMHDGGGDRTETVAALPRIIRGLHARGYRLVNVPTLLRENPPPFEHRVPFSRCEQPGPARPAPRPALPDDPIGGPWTWRAMLDPR